MKKINIGFHVNKKSELDLDIKNYFVENKINTFQIFVSGPMNMNFNKINYDAVKKINCNLFVHSCYIDGIFLSTPSLSEKFKFQINHKIEEMKRVDLMDGIGLVIHYGIVEFEIMKFTLKYFLEQMIKNKIRCKLIMEMKASKPGPNTYETSEKINMLSSFLEEIDPEQRIKICMDTSHFHATGIKFSSYNDCKNYFNSLTENSIKRIILFHLNGNRHELGSGKDQHNKIAAPDDKIWGKYKNNIDESGIKFLVDFSVNNNIFLILERHENVEQEIKLVYSLINF